MMSQHNFANTTSSRPSTSIQTLNPSPTSVSVNSFSIFPSSNSLESNISTPSSPSSASNIDIVTSASPIASSPTGIPSSSSSVSRRSTLSSTSIPSAFDLCASLLPSSSPVASSTLSSSSVLNPTLPTNSASKTFPQPTYGNTTSAGFQTLSTTSSSLSSLPSSSLLALSISTPTNSAPKISVRPTSTNRPLSGSQTSSSSPPSTSLTATTVCSPASSGAIIPQPSNGLNLLQVGPGDASYDLSQSDFLDSISFPNSLECRENLVFLYLGTAVPALDTYTTTEYVAFAISYAALVLGRRATILARSRGNLNVQWALKY
ncbi:hypothetical protein BDZ45DRAFT_89885 [Acephala macrosclerotiorum]|nr:hypothetical protein BDZ45DRAFT_89885 [Acephala macrosclerotiorum]